MRPAIILIALLAGCADDSCDSVSQEAAEYSAKFIESLYVDPEVTDEEISIARATLDQHKDRISACER